MVNLDTWRELTEENRTALTTCGAVAAQRGLQLSKTLYETDLATLRKAGMVLVEPSDALMADFRERVGRPMTAEWLETAGEGGREAIAAFNTFESAN